MYTTANWNGDIRYLQTTKVIDRFLLDLKKAGKTEFFLETCNMCAASCGIEAVNAKWKCVPPSLDGKAIVSMADIMFAYNYSTLSGMFRPDGVCENEVPENIVKCINALSTAKSRLVMNKVWSNKSYVEAMKEALKQGHACVLSYRTDYGSGHYICLVAYDPDSKEFVAYDSWPNNIHCLHNGIRERYQETFFISRMRNRFIEIEV